MQFVLKPILAEIKELYLKPISNNRFDAYLDKLQAGKKGDLSLPIGGFNPMAKAHILQKIEALETEGAETIMAEVIEEFNSTIENTDPSKITVVLNLADDWKGAWTNFYTTDFDSKFKLNALITRKFCTPYFWSSENYTKDLIRNRTKAYLSRTLFCWNKTRLKKLEAYLAQEVFVCKNTPTEPIIANEPAFELLKDFYQKHKSTEEYAIIFNFFYGDDASAELAYPQFGITAKTGFDYARLIAQQTK